MLVLLAKHTVHAPVLTKQVDYYTISSSLHLCTCTYAACAPLTVHAVVISSVISDTKDMKGVPTIFIHCKVLFLKLYSEFLLCFATRGTTFQLDGSCNCFITLIPLRRQRHADGALYLENTAPMWAGLPVNHAHKHVTTPKGQICRSTHVAEYFAR